MAVIFGPSPWQFDKRTPLGSSFGGGFIICKSGGVVWVLAPSSTQVSRTWYCRNDAVTTAQANATCGDWFVPSQGQLENPGRVCRDYWDSYPTSFGAACFWSCSEGSPSDSQGRAVSFHLGHGLGFNKPKTSTYSVRAFRCVTY